MENLLTQEQVHFYQTNGFVQIDHLLTVDEVEELREYMDESMRMDEERSIQNSKNRGAYYRVLNQKVNSWRDHAGMAKYTFDPRFSQIASKLTMGKKIRLFHDQILWKMPEDSKPTPWHQDFPYWPMEQSGALSIWIALDDVDEQNGCMMFVPKSHKTGLFNPIDLVAPEDLFEHAKDTNIKQQKPTICRLKAGSCTFHDGLTFHYAHANHTKKPRRALAIIYFFDGTTYSGKKHLLTDSLGLQKGELLKGPLFPILTK